MFYTSSAFCEEAAPYTKEAYDKISNATRQTPQLPYKDSTYTEERAYKLLEKQREIFKAAGYSYDATLKKVAKDLQSPNDQIPEDIATIAGFIVAGVHIMMSECENQKIDCLRRYPSDIAQAIKSIRNNSKFSL
jgi:hypothetical protein